MLGARALSWGRARFLSRRSMVMLVCLPCLRLLAVSMLCVCLVACASDPAFEGGDTADAIGADAADAGAVDASADVGAADGDGSGCGESAVVSGNPCDCDGEETDASDELCERTCLCTGGFWSCTEDCRDPASLALSLVGAATVAEAVGNGDGLLQPGETGEVSARIAVENAQEGGADVDVRLRSFDNELTFDGSSEARFEGASGERDVALRFGVQASASAGPIRLQLEVSSGFILVEEEIDARVEGPNQPLLRWSDAGVERVDGNANRDIEVGETWEVLGTLSNEGDREASALEIGARASSATLELAESGAGVPASLDAGESRRVSWRFVVSEPLLELVPVVTLSAGAPDAEPRALDIEVPLTPPDTLLVANASFTGAGDELTLVVTVANTGQLDVTGLDWTRINYASPTPCGGDGEVECEVPFFERMEFGEPDGASSIAADGSAIVELPLSVTDETPFSGRVLLRAQSDLRDHGPYPIEVSR